ncbi:MAG: NTP transferase domain-containing protein, partial [Acidobacteriota bacterium]|nr:NTP transferase domain-containing protein [Acidobacteriota bacterium]
MTPDRKPVRKAVLPVAGLGTRMLPATKAVPKEMLPLLDKPMIQYAVEECHASGIEEVIFVTGPGKSAIEAHFTADPALEALLKQRGRHKDADAIRLLSRIVRVSFARQEKPLGLGHAVLCAKSLVGREPFVVLLPDVFLLGTRPATAHLIEAYAESAGSVVAVESVPPERISQCGIVAVEEDSPRGHLFRV